MLGRYRIPVAVAAEQRGARGESEKAVGSSRGGNWDVLGIWQGRRPPGSLGESGPGPARPFSWAGVGAGCTDVLLWGRKKTRKEEALLRGVFCKTSEQRRARSPELWFWLAEPLFRCGARGFTD